MLNESNRKRIMERHIKNYLDFFGLDGHEFISCECGCGRKGHEFHHLKPRSSFGSKRKVEQDKVENVACINAECHRRAHGDKEFNEHIKLRHLMIMKTPQGLLI